MALRRFCQDSYMSSTSYLFSNISSKLNSPYNKLTTFRNEHFSSEGIPKDVAMHIEQLKAIASQSNKEHLLPQHNKLSKSNHNKKGKNKYIDKYSFSYNQTKAVQKQIKHKEKLTKVLNAMQSHSLPISQGRVIETPTYFEHKLSPIFTENSNISSTEKPSPFNESDIDERMEKEALELSIKKHNSDTETLKTDIMKNSNTPFDRDLREEIESKRRERLNGKRCHFYIKNGERTFGDIGVSDILSQKLKLLGFKCPSHIEYLFIKQYHSLDNNCNSLVMAAETGSGKTLAFLIPIIDEIIEEYISMGFIQFKHEMTLKNMVLHKQNIAFFKYPKCVIIEPSPELCIQVRSVIQSLSRPFGIRVECWTEHHLPPPIPCLYDYLYSHYDDHHHYNIESSPEILVVTPDVFKHVFDTRFALRLNHLVFDEADIMLTHKGGVGHWCHIQQILKTLQKYQKDKLLSGYNSNLHRFKGCLYIFTGATLANKRVQIFLGKHGQRSKKQKQTVLPEPTMKLFKKAIWITSNGQHRHSPNLTQKWLFVRDNSEKQELLLRALHRHPAQKKRYKKEMQSFPPLLQTIIFCNSNRSVDDVERFLSFHRIPCNALHQGKQYQERETILHKFDNNQECPILISTDIMSRGYDFGCNVECVIQCDFAKTPDIHYNRVGRTARAGTKGLAINLYMANNAQMVKQLIDITKGNHRIDKMFKTRKRNKLTKRAKKGLNKMGIDPIPTIKEKSDKLGITPRKKQREFRFYDVQNMERSYHKKTKKDLKKNFNIVDDNDDGNDEIQPFDFDQFLVDTKNVIDGERYIER